MMNYREKEYEATDTALKEMKQNYEEVCRHRLQLEHDLHVATHQQNMLDRQLTETQVRGMDVVMDACHGAPLRPGLLANLSSRRFHGDGNAI